MSPDLPDARVTYDATFLRPSDADALFATLLRDVDWRQDHIQLFGRTHALPRLQQWFADDGLAYTYSRVTLPPAPWPSALDALRTRLQAEVGAPFNSCLASLYRDGQDTNGWHADDEPEFGTDPVIASVSLGAVRTFRMRHETTRQTWSIELGHGSLLVMAGATQRCWKHTVPRRMRCASPRVNLTFRHTLGPSER